MVIYPPKIYIPKAQKKQYITIIDESKSIIYGIKLNRDFTTKIND